MQPLNILLLRTSNIPFPRQEKATRDRHVAKIQAEFEAVTRNLNRYSLKTEEVIVRRLESAKAKYPEGNLFEYALSGRRGRYRLTLGAQREGRGALGTTGRGLHPEDGLSHPSVPDGVDPGRIQEPNLRRATHAPLERSLSSGPDVLRET